MTRFAKSPQSLQSLLNDIENYCNEIGIHINRSKTKAMILKKEGTLITSFLTYNTKIDIVDSFKYLALHFSRTVTDIVPKNAYLSMHPMPYITLYSSKQVAQRATMLT